MSYFLSKHNLDFLAVYFMHTTIQKNKKYSTNNTIVNIIIL